MGLSELMRMIIIFVTLFELKKKIPQGLRGKEYTNQFSLQSKGAGASLVAQWLRICLPMQETRVRALVWEDPTCCGATRPVSHNC